MASTKITPRRYQLNKEGASIVKRGHPWIFRTQISSAASSFRQGQWLKLFGLKNEELGYGIYEAEGIIGIRIIKWGKIIPDTRYFRELIQKRLQLREPLLRYSNSYRALHGENDQTPGVVFDVYDKIGVLQTYSPSVDLLGRYLAGILKDHLKLETVFWKLPAKRKRVEKSQLRRLWGSKVKTEIREGALSYRVDIGRGQKSGSFLDLRGLRKLLLSMPLKEKRVLNLFCYTGVLGLAAAKAGAREIWNVDISKGSLEFGEKYHGFEGSTIRWIAADIFDWVDKLPIRESFDLIIIDPPQMASDMKQVRGALRSYELLHRRCFSHLRKRGTIITCCCSSRIERSSFKSMSDRSLFPAKLVKSLSPESDHPVGFPEGDYLKVLIYKA